MQLFHSQLVGFGIALKTPTADGAAGAVMQTDGAGSLSLTSSPTLAGATLTDALLITKTTEQARIRYDASNYFTVTVGSTGTVTFNSVGAGAGFTFSDTVTLQANLTLPATTGDTVGVISVASDRFIHTFKHATGSTAVPIGFNTFIGHNSGNFTMGSGATSTVHGSYNVGLGPSSLRLNTLGYSNMAIGLGALEANTEGHTNVAVGTSALTANTTGYWNVGVGGNALLSETTGYQNVGIGASALRVLTTGTLNVGIGDSAGRYLADGTTSNQTPAQCVYIGAGARANAAGATNEIVIGYLAIGEGSNTIRLGNSSITDVYTSGRISIVKTTEQLRVGYDASNYFSVTVGSTGIVTLNAVGAGAAFVFSDDINVTTGAGSYVYLNSVGSHATDSNAYHSGIRFYDASTMGYQFLAAFGNVAASRYAGMLAYSDRHGNRLPQWFFTTNAAGSLVTSLVLAAGANAGKIGTNGVTSPSAFLHVRGTTEQLRVDYDASNYFSVTVGSTGGVTFDAVGAGAAVTFADAVTIQKTLTFGAGGQCGTMVGNYDGSVATHCYFNMNNTSGRSGYWGYPTTGDNDFGFMNEKNAQMLFGVSAAYVLKLYQGKAGIGFGQTVAHGVPTAKLQVRATTEQLRLDYDASNYFSVTVGSTGTVTLDAVGAGAGFTFSDSCQFNGGTASSDGTAGATADVATAKVGGGTRTLHFKNGLYTGYTDS